MHLWGEGVTFLGPGGCRGHARLGPGLHTVPLKACLGAPEKPACMQGLCQHYMLTIAICLTRHVTDICCSLNA